MDEPKLIDSVDDLPWFQRVLERSRGVLVATPPHAQPSWYRAYMAEREAKRASANAHPETEPK